jgi:hypothetical protein
VLTAYVSLAAALGDLFAAAVARGRRDYGHPTQLAALVHAGFVSEEAAVWDTTPQVIPVGCEPDLLAAEPARAVAACEAMDWADPPRYYMFKRRIDHWSAADAVRRDLKGFRKTIGG